jgi:cell division protein FtsB
MMKQVLTTICHQLKEICVIIFPIIKSRYGVMILFFFVTNLFGDYSFFRYCDNQKRIESLQAEKSRLTESMKQDSANIQMLKSRDMLEKFAREKYFMKRKDEVLFIIK